MKLTDDQRELLEDKFVLWDRASREGNMELRDYNRRAAEALKVALSIVSAALSPPSTAPRVDTPCWRCNGEGCIQEGSPEAWNYADCPECGGKPFRSPPSTGGEGEARTYSQAEVDSILKAAFPFQTKSERAAFLSHPSPEMGEWRPEVRAFADLMEAQLRANDHKPGWKDDTDLDLFERLGQESAELLAALRRNAKRLMWGDSWVMEDTVPRVGAEAADVANFAMMIADVCGALKLKENGLSREDKAT